MTDYRAPRQNLFIYGVQEPVQVDICGDCHHTAHEHDRTAGGSGLFCTGYRGSADACNCQRHSSEIQGQVTV